MFGITFGVLSLIQLALLLAGVFALVDAARHPAAAYDYAGKQTKLAWLWLTGLGTACLLLFPLPGLLSLVGVVAVSVYLVDVRPALQSTRRR